jgi:hypothetical protein
LNRVNSDAIVNSSVQALVASGVFVCCLNRHVTQLELSLLQFATRDVAQPSARAPQVVRSELWNG